MLKKPLSIVLATLGGSTYQRTPRLLTCCGRVGIRRVLARQGWRVRRSGFLSILTGLNLDHWHGAASENLQNETLQIAGLGHGGQNRMIAGLPSLLEQPHLALRILRRTPNRLPEVKIGYMM